MQQTLEHWSQLASEPHAVSVRPPSMRACACVCRGSVPLSEVNHAGRILSWTDVVLGGCSPGLMLSWTGAVPPSISCPAIQLLLKADRTCVRVLNNDDGVCVSFLQRVQI